MAGCAHTKRSRKRSSGIAGASEGEKTLFDQAVAVVAEEGRVSISYIQRRLRIGYNKAAQLVEQMEKFLFGGGAEKPAEFTPEA